MAKKPKAKTQRRFGEVLVPRPKYQRILENRGYPPGQHGRDKQYRRGRRSDYAEQLEEKQKLAFIYNVRDRQMRNYYKKAAQQPGMTGANMLRMMERRLDNLVYRAGFAPTIWAARQLVSHRHIMIDGKKVNIASYLVRPGESFSVAPKFQRNPQFKLWIEELGMAAPEYMDVDYNSNTATLVRMPEREEIPVPVDEQRVVEYYNRRA